jgi:hypothetical protein
MGAAQSALMRLQIRSLASQSKLNPSMRRSGSLRGGMRARSQQVVGPPSSPMQMVGSQNAREHTAGQRGDECGC